MIYLPVKAHPKGVNPVAACPELYFSTFILVTACLSCQLSLMLQRAAAISRRRDFHATRAACGHELPSAL